MYLMKELHRGFSYSKHLIDAMKFLLYWLQNNLADGKDFQAIEKQKTKL